MTFVAIVVKILEVLDGLVGHKVVVVVEQAVETETIGELKLVTYLPVILGIDTKLVRLHAGCRLGFAVIAVSKADNLRSSAVNEIIDGFVAIVACTVTHVLVVGHLVLEVDTGHKLMAAEEICKVILYVGNGVVHSVVPCKELISESHVVVVVASLVRSEDIDERELA